MSTDPRITAALERFDKKWKRIEKSMTGHLSGRNIWDVSPDDDDEGGYAYVDESIKSFISSELTKIIEDERKEILKKLEYQRLKKVNNNRSEGTDIINNWNMLLDMLISELNI